MAKKILAVVLAVMMALSAMAITAFAEDAKIPMYALTRKADGTVIYDSNGVVVGDTSNYTTVEVSFDIPVYAMYGYLTQGSTIELTLPRYFGGNIPAYGDSYVYNADHSIAQTPKSVIEWSIVVNGRPFALQEQFITTGYDDWYVKDGDEYRLDEYGRKVLKDEYTSFHKVSVGAFTHDWNAVTNDTQIPQSMGFGDTTTIRLVASITLDGTADWPVGTSDFLRTYDPNSGRYVGRCKADFKDAQGNLVGTSYIEDWNATKTVAGNDSTSNTFTFVSDEWDITYNTTNTYQGVWTDTTIELVDGSTVDMTVAHPITWDHTLANKAILYGSTSDTVKMVVELNNPIVGGATYTLYSSYEAPVSSVNGNAVAYNPAWWTYNGGRKYIAECKVDGSVDKLEFDVPLSALYDSQGYGSYNQEFVIFENVTLLNQNIMKNYYEYYAGMIDQYGSWNLGRLGNTDGGKVTYDGQQVRYAAGGTSSQQYVYTPDHQDWGRGGKWIYKQVDNPNYAGTPRGWDNKTTMGYLIPAKASAIYLLVPQGEATDVKNPQQGTENDEESENVDDGDAPEVDAGEDTETTEPEAQAPAAEENNPTTGIALAVLPMIVSAAAAVISKKH